VGVFRFSFRWEDRQGRRRWSFTVPADNGEVRGEVDDSLTVPVYEVQHCVVDTYDGRIIISPTSNRDKADELAARLNAAQVEKPKR
jgi:hypothetical protein